MQTYKKKSLKVHNIYATSAGVSYSDTYSHRIADNLKDFIEKGNYSRIAEIKIYGETNPSLVCSIIYEESKGRGV